MKLIIFLKKIILFILVINSTFSYSQKTITISGYIEEAETGEKLIGASIYDIKSKKGTISNDYGFFSLTIPVDSIKIRVSYIGYVTQIYEDQPNVDINKNFALIDQMLQ